MGDFSQKPSNPPNFLPTKISSVKVDFSENLSLKPKFEVQSAHFSGKQYSLQCLIVKPGENKYVYNLSDATNHDSIFANEVLEDLYKCWEIKDEAIIIKSFTRTCKDTL